MYDVIEGKIKTISDVLQNFKAHVTETGERIIEGYFSTKEPDRGGDITLPSAFTKTMKQFENNPIVTFMHDWKLPMGKMLEYKIDNKGVFVKLQIAKDVQWIDDQWALIEQGVIKALSFGYRTVSQKKVEKSGVTYKQLNEVDLYEISVVTIPMNASALFTVSSDGIKSISIRRGSTEDNIDENTNKEIISIKEVKFSCDNFSPTEAFKYLEDLTLNDSIGEMSTTEDAHIFIMKSGVTLDSWTGAMDEGISIIAEEVEDKTEEEVEEKTEEEVEEKTEEDDEDKGALGDELAEQERKRKSDLFNIFYKTTMILLKVDLSQKASNKEIKTILTEFNEIALKVARDFIEIQQSYYEEAGISLKAIENVDDFIDEIMAMEEKAGRVLSAKNRSLIDDCVKSLNDSHEMLKTLLEAATDAEPKNLKDVDTKDVEEEENNDDNLEDIKELTQSIRNLSDTLANAK